MIDTDKDKLCPFQSDSQGDVYCTKERCMAWGAVGGTCGDPIYGCRLIP